MAASSPRVAVVDYGAGNLRSVSKALERSGFVADVTAAPEGIRAADCVVLPGVGAFADAMKRLEATGLGSAVREALDAGRPYLGLCLGLQVLFEESDEHGVTKGLGVLPGRVERFPASAGKVPQIGWNQVDFEREHPLFDGVESGSEFYFVNSYFPEPADDEIVIGSTEYGDRFASAVARGSIVAKSGD